MVLESRRNNHISRTKTGVSKVKTGKFESDRRQARGIGVGQRVIKG